MCRDSVQPSPLPPAAEPLTAASVPRRNRLVKRAGRVCAAGGLLVWASWLAGCAESAPIRPPAIQGVSAIATGWTHSCLLTTDGRVRCWGNNQDGQLGDGTRATKYAPESVVGLLGSASDVAVGERHTCILTVSGGVKCWGSNQSAQLGDGTRVDRVTPTEVLGLSGGVRMVAAGDRHTCALTTRGSVQCWGSNRYGQLGDGTYEERAKPVQVSNLESGVVAIAAGWRHTCALMESGGVRCWGHNHEGQLGDRTHVDKLIPVEVSGLSGATMIAAGGRHTCALLAAGTVSCWGGNERGQLGLGTTESVAAPAPVAGLTDVRAIAAGWQHTCAVMRDGRAACWGNNEKGQVVAGGGVVRKNPTLIPSSMGAVVRLAAGGHHTCLLSSGGALRCWGDNEYGQSVRQ